MRNKSTLVDMSGTVATVFSKIWGQNLKFNGIMKTNTEICTKRSLTQIEHSKQSTMYSDAHLRG